MPSPQCSDAAGRSAAALSDGDLERILESVPCLAGRPRTIERVSGGLTNLNVKVTFADPPGESVIARIVTRDSALLAIDRDAEHANTLTAASCGVAPPVTCRAAEAGVLVVDWIEGRTWTPEDVRVEANLPRVAEVCRRLHAGPPFVGDFNMFDVQRRYLASVRQNGFRLPSGYLELMPAFESLERALAVRAGPRVPCHNDLLAENFIDDSTRLWLVDFEYSGNNDACFELGNIAAESQLAPEQLAELVQLYYGRADRRQCTRARLFGLASAYGWTLWAVIQAATSTIEADFWSWGMEKYERAAREFTGTDFHRQLQEVTATA